MTTDATTIEVSVNGQRRRVASDANVSDLIDQLGHAPPAVATAVNGEFVSRADRAARPLREGDAVTCFQAIVGG